MKYSETFLSMQGEGKYTGVPCVWLRLFSCNLNCNGFGQKDPTDPSTYTLPYQEIDVSKIKHINDLPVITTGCDSAFSWSARFKDLITDKSYQEVIEELHSLLPDGRWHYDDGRQFHMVFTGGEPLLKANQKHIVELLEDWNGRFNSPSNFTIETNGTQPIGIELLETLRSYQPEELFLSISPKLFSVSGEPAKRAIKVDVILKNLESLREYNINFDYQLKFVVGNDDRQWAEMEDVIDELGLGRSKVWIMPVGANAEGLKDVSGEVADEAIRRGYNVSARVHAYLWDNVMGK